ncbi:MAG: amidohydrolase family protein, partial [Actinomycetota bacterium]
MTAPGAGDLRLRDWRPEPTLVVREHPVHRARLPTIDAHNHLGRWLSPWLGDPPDAWVVRDVGALLYGMDACNIRG